MRFINALSAASTRRQVPQKQRPALYPPCVPSLCAYAHKRI